MQQKLEQEQQAGLPHVHRLLVRVVPLRLAPVRAADGPAKARVQGGCPRGLYISRRQLGQQEQLILIKGGVLLIGLTAGFPVLGLRDITGI